MINRISNKTLELIKEAITGLLFDHGEQAEITVSNITAEIADNIVRDKKQVPSGAVIRKSLMLLAETKDLKATDVDTWQVRHPHKYLTDDDPIHDEPENTEETKETEAPIAQEITKQGIETEKETSPCQNDSEECEIFLPRKDHFYTQKYAISIRNSIETKQPSIAIRIHKDYAKGFNRIAVMINKSKNQLIIKTHQNGYKAAKDKNSLTAHISIGGYNAKVLAELIKAATDFPANKTLWIEQVESYTEGEYIAVAINQKPAAA